MSTSPPSVVPPPEHPDSFPPTIRDTFSPGRIGRMLTETCLVCSFQWAFPRIPAGYGAGAAWEELTDHAEKHAAAVR